MAKKPYQDAKEAAFTSSPESGSVDSNTFGITEPIYDDKLETRGNWPRRVIDGFKRDPHRRATPIGAISGPGGVFDVETAAQNTADSPLARKLKGRHLQMIAIGGSIGMLLSASAYESILTHIQAPGSSLHQESPCRMVVQRRSLLHTASLA